MRSKDRSKNGKVVEYCYRSLNDRPETDYINPKCIEYVTNFNMYKIENIIWDRYKLNFKVIGPDMGQTLGFHRCYGPAIGPAILSNLANQNS